MIIEKIAEALGLVNLNVDEVTPQTTRLHRIAEKVTRKPGEAGFEEDVEAAEQAADEEGTRALLGALGQCLKIGIPEEKVYKIKRSEKGQRIEMKSESGIRFSFGPIWVQSVAAGKGIAVSDNNREKLNMHGTHVGIESPEKMSARELCAAIAARS